MNRLAWVVLLAACSSGESPTAATAALGRPAPTPATVRLVGHVTGGSGAKVTAGGKSTTVKADGSYTLDGLPEGGILVVASATGQHDEVAAVSLVPPETTLDLTLTAAAGTIDLAFAGDLAFVSRRVTLPSSGAGYTALVDAVAPLTRTADVAVANLEGPLAEPGEPHPSRPVLLRSPPAAGAALSALGLDVVGLANDHVFDFLDGGLLETLDNVRAAGATPIGAGADAAGAIQTTVVSKNGVRVGFVALSLLTGRGEEHPVAEPPFSDATATRPGVARMELARLTGAMLELRGRADRIVVLLHGGEARATEPAADVATAAHRAIDAGATLVVASHPRALQGVERYKDGLVFYSLGALVFDDDEPEGYAGAVLRVRLPVSGPPTSVRLDPVYTEGLAPGAASGELRRRLLGRLAERSAPLGTTVLADGRVLLQPPGQIGGSDETTQVTADVAAAEGATFDLGEALGAGAATRVALVEPFDAALWLGRNVLLTGSVEDDLADGRFGVPSGFVFPTDAEQVVSGDAGDGRLRVDVCRSGTARDTASARVSGRYPAGGSNTVSLCGCWRGDAGTTGTARLQFYDSLADGAAPLEDRAVVTGTPPGKWECFCHAASGPKGTRFVSARLEHTPSADHAACVSYDKVRLVVWERQLEKTVSLEPLSGVDFVRVTGAAGASVAKISLGVHTVEAP